MIKLHLDGEQTHEVDVAIEQCVLVAAAGEAIFSRSLSDVVNPYSLPVVVAEAQIGVSYCQYSYISPKWIEIELQSIAQYSCYPSQN